MKKATKEAAKLIKDRNFQLGVSASIPVMVGAFFTIKKCKKQIKEKEVLYAKKLSEHNAVIKELNERNETSEERQNRLLVYDAQLKRDMADLQSEICELKNQIAELQKENDSDE